MTFSTTNQAVDNKRTFDAMYLDFKKAVPHAQLLFKLWQIGITGPLWKFFRCYLTNRLHHVTIDSYQSSTLPVISGVPQGSMLSPLLFTQLCQLLRMPSVCRWCQNFPNNYQLPRSTQPPDRPTRNWTVVLHMESSVESWEMSCAETHAQQSYSNLKPAASLPSSWQCYNILEFWNRPRDCSSIWSVMVWTL